MKNTLYAIISGLLVITILFMLFVNMDASHIVEGNQNNRIQRGSQRGFQRGSQRGNQRGNQIQTTETKSKGSTLKKTGAKPIRQNEKRKEQTVCVGKNCKNWSKQNDMTSVAPETQLNDMKTAMDFNNDDYIKDLTQ
jgi:hypothetical protein